MQTKTWADAKLEMNRKAHELAQQEFINLNGHTPETLTELQQVWSRQSVILSAMKKQA